MLFFAYILICQLAFPVFTFRRILISKKKKKAYQYKWLSFRNFRSFRYFYFEKIVFIWPKSSHIIPGFFSRHWFAYTFFFLCKKKIL